MSKISNTVELLMSQINEISSISITPYQRIQLYPIQKMKHKCIDFHDSSQSCLLITLDFIPISDSVAGSNCQDMTYGPDGTIGALVGKRISTTR